MTTQHHLVAIIQHQGCLLAPLPGYAGIQQQLEEWVLTNTVEALRPRREVSGKELGYRGFCRPYRLVEAERRPYPCAMPILCNP